MGDGENKYIYVKSPVFLLVGQKGWGSFLESEGFVRRLYLGCVMQVLSFSREVSIVLQSHFGLCFLCTESFFQFLNAISMGDGENKYIYVKRPVFLLVGQKG